MNVKLSSLTPRKTLTLALHVVCQVSLIGLSLLDLPLPLTQREFSQSLSMAFLGTHMQ